MNQNQDRRDLRQGTQQVEVPGRLPAEVGEGLTERPSVRNARMVTRAQIHQLRQARPRPRIDHARRRDGKAPPRRRLQKEAAKHHGRPCLGKSRLESDNLPGKCGKINCALFLASIPSAPAHTERDPRGLRLDCRRPVFEPRTPLAGRIGRGLYSAQSTSIAMDRREGRSRPIISRSARLGVRHFRRHPRSFETKSATDQTTFASAYLAPHGTILALFWGII